jgi:hypothetical protein
MTVFVAAGPIDRGEAPLLQKDIRPDAGRTGLAGRD